jgi:hypothetical protein
MTLKRGDAVWATIEGQRHFAGVLLASDYTLALHFCNGPVAMGGADSCGVVALWWDEPSRVWRDLETKMEVGIEPAEPVPSGS